MDSIYDLDGLACLDGLCALHSPWPPSPYMAQADKPNPLTATAITEATLARVDKRRSEEQTLPQPVVRMGIRTCHN